MVYAQDYFRYETLTLKSKLKKEAHIIMQLDKVTVILKYLVNIQVISL